jgi:pimeloyl-ACP methyl ester carboxylesterase
MPAAAMDGWVTDLRVNEVIPAAGHWLQQQAPDLVNQHLLGWLDATHGRQ